jgi:gliding motility-associated-like protein
MTSTWCRISESILLQHPVNQFEMKSYSIIGLIILVAAAVKAQIPTITGLSPASGACGIEVSIAGTNFKSGLTDNHVFFGTAKATVTSASETLLKVKVPYGATHAPISVTAAGFTGWSALPFHVTFPTNGFVDVNSFAAYTDLNTDAAPQDVAFGDLDNDGKSDLAVVNSGAGTVKIYRNESSVGTPKFTNVVSLPTALGPFKVAIQDLDRDGNQDLVVLCSGAISVLRNKNPGGAFTSSTFETHIDYPAIGGFAYVNPLLGIADIDLDGLADIITANSNSSIIVWQNLSTPGAIDISSFKHNVTLTAFDDPTGLAVTDVDGDSKPDILAAVRSGNRITAFKNASVPGPLNNAAFLTGVDFTLTQPTTLAAGDLNGDGKPELIAERHDNGHVHVFHNTTVPNEITPGSFAANVDVGAPGNPFDILIEDIDGDSGVDIVVSSQFGPLTAYHNTNNGTIDATTFEPGVNFESPDYMYGIEMGDLDGDGRPDVAAAKSFNMSLLSIALNNVSYSVPPPTISGFTPTSGPIATPVSIDGSGFSETAEDNIVYFGATQATVITATQTNLVVEVPLGATYQPISVTAGGLTATTEAPFLVTFPNGTITGTAFGAKVDFFLTNTAGKTAIGDLDGDGKSDIAALNGNLLSVFINSSTTGTITSTSFNIRVDFTTGFSNPSSIAIADIDGDGKKDIVATDFNPSILSIFHNINTGIFSTSSLAPAVNLVAGGNPRDVAIKDLDGDGKPDLIVADGSTIVLIRNRTTPGLVTTALFEARINLPGAVPLAVIAQDLDSDGKPELIAVGNQLSVYKNVSSLGSLSLSSFEAGVTFPAATTARGVAVADLDGDGKPEIVVTQNGEDVVSVYYNTTNGGVINASSFAPRINFTTGDGPSSVAIADLDGEGKADIIVTNDGPRNVSVIENTSTTGSINASSFAAKVDYTSGIVAGLVVGDIDGDHKPEIIVSNFASSIGVLQNLVAPLPLITASSANVDVCDGATAVLAVTASGTTNLTYQWQKFNGSVYIDITDGGAYSGTTASSLTVTTTGNFGAGDYRCRVAGDLALPVYANATLAVNPVPAPVIINVTGSTSICGTGSVTLDAPAGYSAYAWSDGQTTESITVTVGGDYTVQVSNSAGCQSISSPAVSLSISAVPAQPVITVNGSSEICPASGVVLSGPAGFQSYLWSNGEVSRDILATVAGDFSVTVTNSAGCVSPASTAVTITVATDCGGPIDPANRPPVITPAKFSVAAGASATYPFQGYVSDPDGNLDLSTLTIVAGLSGEGNPSIGADNTLVLNYEGINFVGVDHVTIQVCDDAMSCTQQQMEIDVVGEILVHNGISPDGDGFNDAFYIEHIEVVAGALDNKVTILNRWGDVVFETVNYDNVNNTFVGTTNNGSELPSGNYFYKVEISGGKTYTGYLTLKR